MGIIQRDGKVFAVPVVDTKGKTILPIIESKVEAVSKVYTDEVAPFRALNKDFEHSFVGHSAAQYVEGSVHTNSMESFGTLFKRGIVGIYHHTSAKTFAFLRG